MFYLRSTQIITTVSLVFIIAISGQAQSTTAKGGSATFSGKVSIKGAPAKGVTVLLQPKIEPDRIDPREVYKVKTNANGEYRITGIAAGHYQLRVLAPSLTSTTKVNCK